MAITLVKQKEETWIYHIADESILDEAFAWICKAREDYSHNDDVWSLRYRWATERSRIQHQLIDGTYRFSPLRIYQIEGQRRTLWSAPDALVLKAITLVLTQKLKPYLSTRCYHLKGQGGLKGGVRETQAVVSDFKFVFRSDIQNYYASIEHDQFAKILHSLIPDKKVFDLILQSLKRIETAGGEYWEYTQGIAVGSPLSPLLGAIALLPLDKAMEKSGIYYARYMDDWCVLTKTRSQLRSVIKVTHAVLNRLKQSMHPLKTFIGRIGEGFSFLGYYISPRGLGVSSRCILRAAEKLSQLYEQYECSEPARIAEYIRRWTRWVRAGVELSEKVVSLILADTMKALKPWIVFNSGLNFSVGSARMLGVLDP